MEKSFEDFLLVGLNKQNENYKKLLAIVKRAAKNSCCICCDNCLACDAHDLLKEIGEWK